MSFDRAEASITMRRTPPQNGLRFSATSPRNEGGQTDEESGGELPPKPPTYRTPALVAQSPAGRGSAPATSWRTQAVTPTPKSAEDRIWTDLNARTSSEGPRRKITKPQSQRTTRQRRRGIWEGVPPSDEEREDEEKASGGVPDKKPAPFKMEQLTNLDDITEWLKDFVAHCEVNNLQQFVQGPAVLTAMAQRRMSWVPTKFILMELKTNARKFYHVFEFETCYPRMAGVQMRCT